MTETEARGEIERRGLSLERFGAGWRVRGPGIDILFASFAGLNHVDFSPADYRPMVERERMREA